jgi:hypothetical protein
MEYLWPGIVGGCERAESDFRSLLANTGLAISRIVPTEASPVIECHRV